MRLTRQYQETIKRNTLNIFGKDTKVMLFGSRVDDAKKGGDIDLYIVLPYKVNAKKILEKKSEFKLQLYSLLGEQKIDMVVSIDKSREIEKIAIRDGIMLNDKMIRVNKYLNECDKHTLRINKSFSKVKHIFPLSGSGYESLNDEERECSKFCVSLI